MITKNVLQTLEEFIKVLQTQKMYSRHTLDAYYRDINFFLNTVTFGNIKIKDLAEINIDILENITKNQVKEWIVIKKEKSSNRSIARNLSAVKSFFQFLQSNYNVKNYNILTFVLPKYQVSLPKALESKLLIDLIENFKNFLPKKLLLKLFDWEIERDRLIILLLFSTGLRIDELLSIELEDLLNNNFLTVIGKGGKQRQIPMVGDNSNNLYLDYRISLAQIEKNNKNFFFIDRKGKKLRARYIQKLFENIRNINNLPDYMTPHAIRHSCATGLLENGASINQIQKLLGHSNLSTTQIYTKVTQKNIINKLRKIDW